MRGVIGVILLMLASTAAGCATEAPDDGKGPSTGVQLVGTTDRTTIAPGERATAELVFINHGPGTVHIPEGCGEPWHFEVQGAQGSTIQHAPPLFRCLGFQVVPLAPGEQRNATFWWDGQVYDDPDNEDQGRPAEPGTYHLVVRTRTEEPAEEFEWRGEVQVA